MSIFRFAIAIAVGLAPTAVQVSDGASPHDRRPEDAAVLHTDWPVGATYRYRATWKREGQSSLPDTDGLMRGMQATLHARVSVAIVGRTDAGYELRWMPEIDSGEGAADAASTDVVAMGTALWRHQQSVPLDVALARAAGGEWTWEIRNLAQAHEAIRREVVQRVAAIGIDCDGREREMCEGLVAKTNFELPLLECLGIDVAASPPTEWTEPHASIGEAVPVKYRREVIARSADEGGVEVRRTWEPDADALRAWLESEIGKTDAPSEAVAIMAAMSVRMEQICVVDRESGWPISFKRRLSSTGAPVTGSEVVEFERIPNP